MTWVSGPAAYRRKPWWWPVPKPRRVPAAKSVAKKTTPSIAAESPRPRISVCVDCGAEFTVASRGPVPKRCEAHRRVHYRARERVRDRARSRTGEVDAERSRDYYARNREIILEKHRTNWYPANRSSRKMQALRYQEAMQAATAPRATFQGLPWTGIEDAVLVESELRTVEIALALGRTYREVTTRRTHLRGLVAHREEAR